MALSSIERECLDRAVKLRSLVRQLDAPFLHEKLNEEAEFLLHMQREWGKRNEEMEKVVRCIEDFILATHSLSLEASNTIKRYRELNPRKD